MKSKFYTHTKLFHYTALLLVLLLQVFNSSELNAQSITPWRMNRDGVGFLLPLPCRPLPFHGAPCVYDFVNIPLISDPNWVSAPTNGLGQVSFSEASLLPAGSCLSWADFTYFETQVTIPSDFVISTFTVSFSQVDDGARAYIFNSAHPGGAFIAGGDLVLGGPPVTANLASLAMVGEINRIVIAQYDDCPVGNNLIGAQVVLNGHIIISITCPQDITVNTTSNQCGASVLYPAASAGGTPTPAITYSPSTTFFSLGTTLVTATATNSTGSATCSFNVTVVDNEPPVISCPINQTIEVMNNPCAANYIILDPISDNCNGTNWGYALSGETIDTVSGIADGTNSGSISFNQGITTVTLSGTDGTNSATTCSFTVTVYSTLHAVCSNSNSTLYFGHVGDQSSIIKVIPTGGQPPYTVSITMDRPLKCNVFTSTGNEVWTGIGGTSVNNLCPATGPGLTPVSTGSVATSGGFYSLNVSLMEDAIFTATITDAFGCTTTCTTSVQAEDARCFAGNSGNTKVTLCHRTGSANNPCVQICVDQSAVADHLAHGDFLGTCTADCVNPTLLPRGVESHSNVFNIVAINNPTKLNFILNIESSNTEKINIVVYDAIGRVVDRIVTNYSHNISFGENVKVGHYFVDVIQGNNRKVIKLVKVY